MFRVYPPRGLPPTPIVYRPLFRLPYARYDLRTAYVPVPVQELGSTVQIVHLLYDLLLIGKVLAYAAAAADWIKVYVRYW